MRPYHNAIHLPPEEVGVFLRTGLINVLDISQTIMQGYFTMVMVVDISGCSVSFAQLSEGLKAFGESRSLSIRIQRGDIFDSMHRI